MHDDDADNDECVHTSEGNDGVFITHKSNEYKYGRHISHFSDRFIYSLYSAHKAVIWPTTNAANHRSHVVARVCSRIFYARTFTSHEVISPECRERDRARAGIRDLHRWWSTLPSTSSRAPRGPSIEKHAADFIVASCRRPVRLQNATSRVTWQSRPRTRSAKRFANIP